MNPYQSPEADRRKRKLIVDWECLILAAITTAIGSVSVGFAYASRDDWLVLAMMGGYGVLMVTIGLLGLISCFKWEAKE